MIIENKPGFYSVNLENRITDKNCVEEKRGQGELSSLKVKILKISASVTLALKCVYNQNSWNVKKNSQPATRYSVIICTNYKTIN